MDMESDVIALSAAIRGRNRIEFVYKGARRKAEPFVVGILPTGKAALRAYEVAGGGVGHMASSNQFKLYLLAEMSQLEVLPETFATIRPNYRANDTAFKTILASF